MAVEIVHSGETVVVESLCGVVDAESQPYEIGVSSGLLEGGTPYMGDYEARALFSEQTFPTAMKTMSRDFSVRAINYTEAPNESGITLTIGG